MMTKVSTYSIHMSASLEANSLLMSNNIYEKSKNERLNICGRGCGENPGRQNYKASQSCTVSQVML